MTNNKSSQERTELHRTIWSIANDLRGSVDGWDFKQYVLGMLFYRYVSENLSNYINQDEREAGNPDFDYAKISNEDAELARQDLVATKGFFILPSELFENVKNKAASDENLNETLERIFKNIESSAQGTPSEVNFKGLFDDIDPNSNKLGGTVAKRNERLVKLINGVSDMKLGDYRDNSIDAFGDAYEYLMGMYASNAGKSGGEYYTPQEVSELLTHLTLVGKTEVNKVYDPACGSGSLLLKFAKILGKENVRQGFYGQEINITTYNLCRINMFLHDIDFDKFDIAHGDTLTDAQHWDDEPFEAIVSNPPYSIKWDGDSNPLMINDPRFSPAGVLAPKAYADLAFIMHSLSWLSTNGTAAIVCFPGVLYRQNAETKIRKYLIDNNFIDAIIQLPDNLFFGTPIGTCILVLKKSKSDNKTLFIDASKEYSKSINNNKLESTNIHNILQSYINRESNLIPLNDVLNSEIASENYILSVSKYIVTTKNKETVDIDQLNSDIERIIIKQKLIRDELNVIIDELKVIQQKYANYSNFLFDGESNTRKIELGRILKRSKGTKITAQQMSELHKDNGEIRIFAGGKTIADVSIDDIPAKDVITKPSIIVKSRGKIGFEYYEKPFSHKNEFWSYYNENEGINLKFVYYYLINNLEYFQNIANNMQMPQISIPVTDKFEVPIPPIHIQNYIVNILDKFDKLVNDISEGLPAEIAARLKQYEYYRDKLLTFKEVGNESI